MLIQHQTPQIRARFGRFGSLTTVLLLLGGVALGEEAVSTPPSITASASEPVRYVGREQTDKRFYDGALRHAVGVHK